MLSSVVQDKDLDQVMSAVKAWLDFSRNTRWLMIYDNLDNLKALNNPDGSVIDILQSLPHFDYGSVIITMRSLRVRYSKRIYIQKLLNIVTAGSLQRSKHSVQLNPNVIENTKLRKLKGEGNLDL